MENEDEFLQKEVVEDKPELPGFLKEVDIDPVQVVWGTMAGGFQIPEYTLSYCGSPFAPLGGIHSLTGKSGNGKTMTFAVLMSAILGGEYMGLKWELPDIEPTVLYIDTEMEDRNTKMVVARVHTMSGFPLDQDNPRFRWVNLRDVENVADRWRIVLKAIETFRPTVAFLDGNLDLVADFNEVKECQPHIRRCMAIASYYHMSLWCLVHENPKSEKMVGHLGSMLERKATDVFCARKVKKNKKDTHPIFEIENMKVRGEDTPMFSFQVERDATHLGIPRLIESDIEGEEPEPMAFSTSEVIDIIFRDKKRYQTRELREAVKDKTGNKSTTKAIELINEALEKGLLIKEEGKNDVGRVCTFYSSPISDGEKMFTSDNEDELPF